MDHVFFVVGGLFRLIASIAVRLPHRGWVALTWLMLGMALRRP
jgi:hypothetical protein